MGKHLVSYLIPKNILINIRYIYLAFVIAFGIIIIISSGGGDGSDDNSENVNGDTDKTVDEEIDLPIISCCPHPGDGEYFMSPDTFLSWCQSNTTLQGDLTYDIYLGTSDDPPLVESDHETLLYFPDHLSDDTTYYWKIISKNDQELTEEGPLWQFHTQAVEGNNPPDAPFDPWPENDAMNVASPDLSWSCSDPNGDDITYHLFWGLTEVLNNHAGCLKTATYILPSLTCWYRHYWKVIAEDEHGAATEGPMWYFDGAPCGTGNRCPDEPFNPSPSEDDTCVNPDSVNLTWECDDPDDDEITYDLYWGTTYPFINNPKTDLTTNSYPLDDLQEGVCYYWQVIAKDEHGCKTDGPVWKFLTCGLSVPIVNTVVTNYHGEGIDLIYTSARSESWDMYVNDIGIIAEAYQDIIMVGQYAIAGLWAFGDPPEFGWKVENDGWHTKGEYSLASKAGYSEAKLVIFHGLYTNAQNINEPFLIEFFIDGVKVADQSYQQLPDSMFDRIIIPLPFDSVKTGSEIPVEFRTNRVKQMNPVPLFEPVDFPHYCFEFINGTAQIVLE